MLISYWVVVLVIWTGSQTVVGQLEQDLTSNETQRMETWAHQSGGQPVDTRAVRHTIAKPIVSMQVPNSMFTNLVDKNGSMRSQIPNKVNVTSDQTRMRNGYIGNTFYGNPYQNYGPNYGNRGPGYGYSGQNYGQSVGYNNNGFPGHGYGYSGRSGSVLNDLLILADFKENDCDTNQPTLKANYRAILFFSRQSFCNKVLQCSSCAPVQTVVYQKGGTTSVNRIQILVAGMEPRGSHYVATILGLAYEGNGQGRFVAIRATFPVGHLSRFCNDYGYGQGYGYHYGSSSHITSDDSDLIMADITSANTLVDCHDSPNNCWDKVKTKKLVDCDGKTFVS